MQYLLDTNICIYLIKKRPKEVLEQFQRHLPEDVAVSTITVFELQYGVEKSHYQKRSKAALTKFLYPLNIIDLDHSAAIYAAEVRAQLEKKEKSIGPFDVLIAGLAKSRKMILVTNNTREFKRVSGLALENWIK